ncbi:MAG: Tyrosine recombinase XerD [Chlamydiae bacterium]|nr:Tyrosine recombinase XerD [Chlamydiota bacterium]
MTKLRRRMIEDLRIRNYAAKTIDAYIRCTAQFAKHFDISPDRLGIEHVREYQVFLVETKKASWAIFNQTVCALRFFYRVTLRRAEIIEHIPFPKQEKKLPVILSTEEITRLKSHVAQTNALFKSKEKSIGRTLDFLTQEMLREINTIASKSPDLAITQKAVECKAELEKIREQVQNIE